MCRQVRCTLYNKIQSWICYKVFNMIVFEYLLSLLLYIFYFLLTFEGEKGLGW